MVKASSLKDVLEHVKEERDRLAKMLDEANASIKFLEAQLREASRHPELDIVVQGEIGKESRIFETKTLSEATLAILKQIHKPMKVEGIRDELLKGGYKTRSSAERFYYTVYRTLSDKSKAGDTFKKVGPAEFGLLEWDSLEGLGVS